MAAFAQTTQLKLDSQQTLDLQDNPFTRRNQDFASQNEWIKDVWMDNFLSELETISNYLPKYNHISMVSISLNAILHI